MSKPGVWENPQGGREVPRQHLARSLLCGTQIIPNDVPPWLGMWSVLLRPTPPVARVGPLHTPGEQSLHTGTGWAWMSAPRGLMRLCLVRGSSAASNPLSA